MWKDKFIRDRISNRINLTTRDTKNNVNKITTEQELFNMMTATARRQIKMTEYLSNYVRNNFKSSQVKEAQRNEEEGKGLFQGHTTEEAKRMKEEIINLMAGPKEGHKSEEEASSDIVAMLEQVGMEYVWFLSVQQMTHLVLQHVMFHNDQRKASIIKEIREMDRTIDDVRDLPSDTCQDEYIHTFSQTLHRQELNELVATLDKIIKLKSKLLKARDMLMERRAEVFELYDMSYSKDKKLKNKMIIDIYVMVSYCAMYVYLCFSI